MRPVRLFAFMLLLSLGVIATACGGAAASGQTPGSSSVVATPASQGAPGGDLTITGAGATFPYPLYSRWFYEYQSVDPSVKFNYQSIGSGGGIAQITAKTVDFGASDAILTDEQLAKAPGLQMFPSVAGAVVPTYNLKDADGKPVTVNLKFPYTSLADIFLGKIKKWNDPVLAQANPDVKLPATDIVVVHRSDGSGTTFAFTDYLSKVSPDWKSQVGNSTSVKWPVGLGGKGNEGVSGTVAQNDGAIGYVELAYALENKLPYGSVQNKAGNYVMPTTAAVQSAMQDFGSKMGEKLAVSIANAPGKDSWPIATYTYLLIYMNQQNCTKSNKLVAFVKWALNDGTKTATDLKYIPLPDAVKSEVLTRLDQIKCQ
ncbi:MAG: phosphate ABC transporter substrate-binding protein PstS [Rudaea sp.]